MSRDSIWAISAPCNANSGLVRESRQSIENEKQACNQSNKTGNQTKSTNKVFLPAGTSFRLLGLYEDVSNLISKKSSTEQAKESLRKQLLNGHKEQKRQRYLKCLALAGDQLLANQMVFIPTSQTGR